MKVSLISFSLEGLRALARNQNATILGPEYWDGMVWSILVELPTAR